MIKCLEIQLMLILSLNARMYTLVHYGFTLMCLMSSGHLYIHHKVSSLRQAPSTSFIEAHESTACTIESEHRTFGLLK